MTVSSQIGVRSDRCGLEELFPAYVIDQAVWERLRLGPDRPRRWMGAWRTPNGEVGCAVRDLGSMPVAGCEPVRRFSWRAQQRHRPGLEFLVSTGRLHGFESLEERSLLLALDFVGTLVEVVPQPFRLRFETAVDGFREHTPDFLAVFRDG